MENTKLCLLKLCLSKLLGGLLLGVPCHLAYFACIGSPCRDEAVPSRCLPCLCALTQATQPLFQANNIDPSTLSRQQATDLITSCITIMYQPMQAAG